jgi:arginyl-tRNA synthetase
MHSVLDILEKRISAVMAEVTGQAECAASVKPATDPKFGDYQVNGVMPLAKQLKTNPGELAKKIIAKLSPTKQMAFIFREGGQSEVKQNVKIPDSATTDKFSDICQSPEIAGAGFINLRLKPEYVADRLTQVRKDAGRLGVEKTDKPKTIVVDFSGSNIAKHMHVGHLRSTIIGDCICRLLELQGHKDIRQSHIGDWGRNFGIVILGLWHICMAEKRVSEGKDTELYYSKEFEELKVCAEEEQARRNLCQRILIQHERDWEADYKYRRVSPDGELVFHPFLHDLANKPRDPDKFLDQVELAYKFVNKVEECVKGLGLKIKTRHLTDPNQIELIPYEYLSRRITAMLHQGQEIGPEINDQEGEGWKIVRDLTVKEGNEIFGELNVGLKDDHIRGESFYKDMLADVVGELKKKELVCFS